MACSVQPRVRPVPQYDRANQTAEGCPGHHRRYGGRLVVTSDSPLVYPLGPLRNGRIDHLNSASRELPRYARGGRALQQ